MPAKAFMRNQLLTVSNTDLPRKCLDQTISNMKYRVRNGKLVGSWYRLLLLTKRYPGTGFTGGDQLLITIHV